MDSLTTYQKIVETVLLHYVETPYAYGEIQNEPLFDREAGRFAVMSVGWHGPRRIHSCLVHIDLIDGKVWVQRDGTEGGIANDLVAAGIPRDQIVLGFQSREVRHLTAFATAS